MMKKLLVMLMALMMFATSGYAEKSEAEIAKESFNAMVADITGQIEASYKAHDSAIVYAPDREYSSYDNESRKRGWCRYMYDYFYYDTKFIEPAVEDEPYKATLEMSFTMLNVNNHLYPKYFDTAEEAANVPCDKDQYWQWTDDLPFFVLFTYEYKKGQWHLIKSQTAKGTVYEPGSGYDKVLDEEDKHIVYGDFKNHKLYKPLDIFLVKNHAKSPFLW